MMAFAYLGMCGGYFFVFVETHALFLEQAARRAADLELIFAILLKHQKEISHKLKLPV